MKTVFLDRDGVINRDSADYIKNWDEFEFLPGSLDAIRRLTSRGFDIFVITNQSVINRKMVAETVLHDMFQRMRDAVESAGGRILDIFYCPHIPEDDCDCRKPQPGLIFQAQAKYNIDISTSYMVGDSAKDIECARNAGCAGSIFVLTGNSASARKEFAAKHFFPDAEVPDLNAAADWIIEKWGGE
jgi:D-glycero-D-manno-heptose 1,7-bisphosphate phosphatase